ncbi:MAG: SpoIID/LytB domain-containing protein [Clostridiales bacterium]|nr:SpoIID/LytB domain-containing protein [Clostridiales bacterium]
MRKWLFGLGFIWLFPCLVSLICMRAAAAGEQRQEADTLLGAARIPTGQEEDSDIVPEDDQEQISRRIILERDGIRTYMELEDYLPGVVACQIGSGHEAATLQCQAVIARTYIRRLMGQRGEINEEELDLDYLSDMQALSAGQDELALRLSDCREAVQATRGVVMKYEDQFILPLFHEMSAGRTRTGDAQFPYLQSVDSSSDCEKENYLQTCTWSREEFAALINALSLSAPIATAQLAEQIQTVSRDDAGYMMEIKIGAHTYSGEEVQYALGLASPCFTISGDEAGVRVTVRGRGHGYGLSQAGADAMARQGWEYTDILRYYYKNISLIFE